MAQLNKLSLRELFQLADGKTGALSVTLCPLDPFTSPMEGGCRSQQNSANVAGHCTALPLLQQPAGLMKKGTQAKQGLPENWEGKEKKLLPS